MRVSDAAPGRASSFPLLCFFFYFSQKSGFFFSRFHSAADGSSSKSQSRLDARSTWFFSSGCCQKSEDHEDSSEFVIRCASDTFFFFFIRVIWSLWVLSELAVAGLGCFRLSFFGIFWMNMNFEDLNKNRIEIDTNFTVFCWKTILIIKW